MMKFAQFILFILLLSTVGCLEENPKHDIEYFKKNEVNLFDPTGVYIYDSLINGNSKYFGEIRIKKLVNSQYIMTFFICKGQPSYNSGSFIDTLIFSRKEFKYTTSQDTSCLTTFNVSDSGIVVNEKTDNYNFGCGFGHAVVAHGFFRRTSNSLPILFNPLNGDTIK